MAPEIVAETRGNMTDSMVIKMLASAKERVEDEERLDPGAIHSYKFHFVSAYLYSHVVAELLPEMDCDRIMDYINDEWDLFPGE